MLPSTEDDADHEYGSNPDPNLDPDLSLARHRSHDLDHDHDHDPEPDPDPSSFSFSAASTSGLTSGLSTPAYLRGDSLPASGVPPRLQTHSSSFTAFDYASSATSSPAAASTDLSLDNDRAPDLVDSASTLQPPDCGGPRSLSPLVNSFHRAVMGGAADIPHRSSSPLKRRASSMEPDGDPTDAKEDVDMINAPVPVPDASEQLAPGPQEQQAVEEAKAEPVPPPTPEAVDALSALVEAELPLRTDIPPLNQQVKAIEALVKAFAETPVQEGDVAYLVSRKWLTRAQSFGAQGKLAGKASSEVTLGPVDNSDIIQTIFVDASNQQCVKLKPAIGMDHFEMFPEDAWDLLLTWYGLSEGQVPIVRTAHNTAVDSASLPNIQFEFHPPVFTIHRLWAANSPIPIDQEIKLKKSAPPVLVHSATYGFHNFLKQAKQLTGVAKDRKVRLWRVLQISATEPSTEPLGMKTPPDSPFLGATILTGPPVSAESWPEMLVDVETFLKLERDVERGVVEAEDTTTNANYNGRSNLALAGLTVDHVLVIDEQIDRDSYVSNSVFKNGSAKDKHLATNGSSGTLTAQTSQGRGSGRNSPALQGPLTRGRAQQKSGRSIGCVGLQNLGNTCYMNSALQCVRSVEELTKYFLTGEAAKEINPDNPLSHNGEVAQAYSKLLFEIYKDPPPNSIAPRAFKGVIGRYAPSFSGYGQQDSQEFIGFLLDGLQEDLSRVKKKPYIEKPDSTDDMIGNQEAIREMAAKVWDITKKRDDSVIADLFTGMYKSTLVCPECEKVSITFDPFNNLTLPLPIANVWSKNVRYFPLNDAPVDIVVELDKNASSKALKQFISARVGVPVERLFGAEEFRDKFFKFYDDYMSISEEIQQNDNPTMHELEVAPTNFSGVKKPKKQKYKSLLSDTEPDDRSLWDDPMAERMVVPVLHRLSPEEPGFRKNRYARSKNNGEVPPSHFIVVTPEEARSEDIIRRKILEKVATFTTWSEFSSVDPLVEEMEVAEAMDPEMANTTSDVDSAGDSKIVAKSVEGEEDIVDVTMSDSGDARKAPAPAEPAEEYPLLLNKFNKQRPKWVDPAEFLNPQCQNLFELCYYKEETNQHIIPTGWTAVQEDNILPKLSSRAPRMVASDVEMRSPEAWEGSEESGSDDNAVTRMIDESSEEDSDFPKVRNMTSRAKVQNHVSARGKNKKSNKIYGRKGKKRFEKERASREQQPIEVVEHENGLEPDGGPLIRLGEGIVVDWSESAFDTVFGGNSPNDMAGMKTYRDVAILEDPGLDAKRKQRQMRRKHGITLDDCLAEFEKEEILSEQDTWYCPRCKEHRRASKKFDLWKTPDILVVHLKRFSSSGYRRDKLDILVDFPVEGLDLTERVIEQEDGKQEIYDLIAVDDHWGGLGGGHYTAFAKNFMDGEWYEFNDTSASKQKDTARIVTNAAYLLFYRRRSDIPLGGARFQGIVEKFNTLNAADEDMQDSGEGQRLGQGSSLRGSPSASTGAGLTLPQGKLGLVNSQADPAGESPNDADLELPSYQQASLDRAMDGDDDAEMGPDLPWNRQETLRNSIEGDGEDEAIHMADFEDGPSRLSRLPGLVGISSTIATSNWSFENLKAGSDATGQDDDLASDIAQGDNSSVTDDAFADPTDDVIEPFRLADPDVQYVGTAKLPADFVPFETHIPEPSAEDQEYMGRLASQAWMKQFHTVPADAGDDQVSDKVAEIHVGDEPEPQEKPVV